MTPPVAHAPKNKCWNYHCAKLVRSRADMEKRGIVVSSARDACSPVVASTLAVCIQVPLAGKAAASGGLLLGCVVNMLHMMITLSVGRGPVVRTSP